MPLVFASASGQYRGQFAIRPGGFAIRLHLQGVFSNFPANPAPVSALARIFIYTIFAG
jgi:hypothetical protein